MAGPLLYVFGSCERHCKFTRDVHPFETDTKGRHSSPLTFCKLDRLVGLVVKASASRAEDPGFESRLRRDFFGVESYQ